MPRYPDHVKIRASDLRKQGASLNEISQELGVAKSTASLWTKGMWLDQKAWDILVTKSHLSLEFANAAQKYRRQKLFEEIRLDALKTISDIPTTISVCKALCSFLYWAEGCKNLSYVNFMNSDPQMVRTFLHLLRKGYKTDPKKFRVQIHLHDYHSKNEITAFWSSVTQIPQQQFRKPYLKPNTGKRKRLNYNGCVSIRYYDFKVAREIRYIYNAYADSCT